MKDIQRARRELLQIYLAAISRVEGERVVAEQLQRTPPDGEISLVAIGKAAASMARGAARELGEQLVDGLVISKPGHLGQLDRQYPQLHCIIGGHPLPDQLSLDAGQHLLRYLAELPAQRPLLFLISGGCSALVEVLHQGLQLEQLQQVNQWLLGSGLSIGSINRVRRALSAIKGGGLLHSIRQRSVSALMISDVAGDDPAVIGSGLLVAAAPDQLGVEGIVLPDWLRSLLPTAQPSPAAATAVQIEVIATLRDAREAAAGQARQLGYPVHLSHAFICAEAENSGRRLALELLDSWPGIYIWGGETTVQLPASPGRGGRNQHLALAAAQVIEGRDDICLLSAGTDGTDGPGEDAGALVDGGTIGRARREGFDADQALQLADSGALLAASGDLIHTGPTGTNVMDLMLGLKME